MNVYTLSLGLTAMFVRTKCGNILLSRMVFEYVDNVVNIVAFSNCNISALPWLLLVTGSFISGGDQQREEGEKANLCFPFSCLLTEQACWAWGKTGLNCHRLQSCRCSAPIPLAVLIPTFSSAFPLLCSVHQQLSSSSTTVIYGSNILLTRKTLLPGYQRGMIYALATQLE